MNQDIPFPNEVILEISFLKKSDFFSLTFNGKKYEIVGRDPKAEGIYIGISENKQVFSLCPDENITYYAASDISVFMQELYLYKDYICENVLSDNPSDEKLQEYADNFRCKIAELDKEAFCNESTFWSLIAEEMEYGV